MAGRSSASRRFDREPYGSVATRATWLANVLRRCIASYIPASRLPGEGELAKRFRVSLRVARRATEILAEEGLVTAGRGKGSITLREPTEPPPVRRIVAIVQSTSQIATPETQAILLGMHDECTFRGRSFTVVRSENVNLERTDCLTNLAPAGSSPMDVGWIFVRVAPPRQVLAAWQTWRLPLVMVDADPRQPGSVVTSDGQRSVELAVERLFLLGHRRLAFVGNTHDDADAPSRARWQGFQLACRRCGLPLDQQLAWPIPATLPRDSHRFLSDRLSVSPRPTAVIAANLQLASDVLAVCDRIHLEIPRQLSVISVGLDRRDLPSELLNRLTRVSEGRGEQLGLMAAEVLLGAQQPAAPVRLLTACEWIDGRSDGPVLPDSATAVSPRPGGGES
jgi:DNA-binding LacI/PurR family transcriptional regulator